MKNKIIIGVIILLLVVGIVIVVKRDKGSYDYCIEWEGLNGGTLHRDNLLYTCYSLASSTFYCDYEVDKTTQVLTIVPILNITEERINYDKPNYFNCSRWLKSK